MAMKSPKSEGPRPIREMLRRLIKAPAALSIIWPALLVVGGYVAWHQWGADHVAEKFYGVNEDLIEVTAPPPFVRTDIVESVYRDTAMDGLSLLDPQATAKIASAFSMNPWVKRVVSVRKLPGGAIDVRLQYRTPVAMVLVEKPETADEDVYFFPVDAEGVLLPTSEFARAETLQYIHIVVPGVYATGLVGAPFGDPRVESAARLAAILSEYRADAGILSIDVPGDPRVDKIPKLELTTSEQLASGDTVNRKRFWGSPPGMEAPGEPTVRMKVETLLSSDASQHADLRRPLGPIKNQSTTVPPVQPASAVSRAGKETAGLPRWVPDGQRVSPVR